MHQANQKINMYYLGIPVQLSEPVDDFRRQFDPKYGVNEAHATLVAPFSAHLMSNEFDQFIAETVAQFKQQLITAGGFFITPQGYIFYTFDKSSAALLHDLYDRLHQYPSFVEYKEMGHSFLPHITIGKFESERDVPQLVREALPEMSASTNFLFDRVRLYGILQEPKKRAHVKDYLLSKN